MTQIQDIMEEDEFEDLLNSAQSCTANEWEETFVDDMVEKYEQYGRRMFISDKQMDHLRRIAEDG